MKRLIIGLLLAVFLVQGCAYHKQTLLKIKGKEVSVPLGPLEGIKGKGLTGFLYRMVTIAFPADKALKTFPPIPNDDSENMIVPTDSIDVQ